MKILIVEDEEHLAVGLKFNFEKEGFEVALVDNGAEALERFEAAQRDFDVVILDLMLPGMSGYETCRQLRGIDPDVPILVLSARSLPEDKARAFDAGGDQYVTKPFDLAELLSRVRNLLERRGRKRNSQERNLYAFDEASVDFDSFEVVVRGEPKKLTQLEMQLLRLFVTNEGRVLSRAEILDKVWGIDSDPTTRTVDNFVLRLRRHFELDPSQPTHFVSVRGAGYRFDA